MISTNGKVTDHNQDLASDGRSSEVSAASADSLPRTLWKAWKAYGHRIARYQTELLLSLVYFLVLGPSGWIARASGKRLIDLTVTPRTTYWIARQPADKTLPGMQRQY